MVRLTLTGKILLGASQTALATYGSELLFKEPSLDGNLGV